MDSDFEDSLRKKQKRTPFLGDSSRKEEETLLETTKARFANVLKRHGELAERLSREKKYSFTIIDGRIRRSGFRQVEELEDSDKMIFERLHNEFEQARASQTQEINLEGEEWNDGLLATVRERVHMEADRKATKGDTNEMPGNHFQEKITYRVGDKVICCLEGARIGIRYETSFAGEPCEIYHCVLQSKSFLEKLTLHEHTVPFFFPIRDIENDLLSSNAMRFIDHIGELLQAYVDRREQVRLIKELYGNQIRELYHSLPFNIIEFVIDSAECKITVSLRYPDLISVLPSRVRVFVWPMNPLNKNGISGSHAVPACLSYAEDALKTMSLPEAYAEIVLNLPQALQQNISGAEH